MTCENDLPQRARSFALKAHADQRYGKAPYSVHLDAVARHCQPYGETAQIVAYLHDVVEDTDVDLKRIEAEFGKFVADCVSILTDESGADRKERKRKTYAKMAKVSGDLELALVVKAADRLANLEASAADSPELLSMYRSEHSAFRASVYRPRLCDALWVQIEKIVDEEKR